MFLCSSEITVRTTLFSVHTLHYPGHDLYKCNTNCKEIHFSFFIYAANCELNLFEHKITWWEFMAWMMKGRTYIFTWTVSEWKLVGVEHVILNNFCHYFAFVPTISLNMWCDKTLLFKCAATCFCRFYFAGMWYLIQWMIYDILF
jgi:hypothetical protein